jgi:hypothetical protein
VSRIFMSHASRYSRQAVALKQWLAEQRPELANEIFLDIDPQTGLRLGQQWKGQLFGQQLPSPSTASPEPITASSTENPTPRLCWT